MVCDRKSGDWGGMTRFTDSRPSAGAMAHIVAGYIAGLMRDTDVEGAEAEVINRLRVVRSAGAEDRCSCDLHQTAQMAILLSEGTR
jgi:hypothetical protein